MRAPLSFCSSLDGIAAQSLIAQNPNPGRSPRNSCTAAAAGQHLSSPLPPSVLNMETLCRSHTSAAAPLCSRLEYLVAETALASERFLLWLLLAMGSMTRLQTLPLVEGPEEVNRILPKSTQETVPENKDDDESDDNQDDEDNEEDGEDQQGDGDEEDYSGEENDNEGDENDDPEANGEGGSEEEDDEEDEDDEGDEEDEEEEEEDEEEDEDFPQPPTKKRK